MDIINRQLLYILQGFIRGKGVPVFLFGKRKPK